MKQPTRCLGNQPNVPRPLLAFGNQARPMQKRRVEVKIGNKNKTATFWVCCFLGFGFGKNNKLLSSIRCSGAAFREGQAGGGGSPPGIFCFFLVGGGEIRSKKKRSPGPRLWEGSKFGWGGDPHPGPNHCDCACALDTWDFDMG